MNPVRVLGMLLKGGGPGGNALLLLVAFAVIAALTYLLGWEINTAIVLALVLLGLVLLKAVLARILAVRNALKVERQLKAQAKRTVQSDDGERSAAEIVRGKFNDASHTVKFSLAGRGSPNTLPWYVVLGPPRSGKTTMIARSGLNFPNLGKASAHRDTVATNNLDWWFTDRGILLDTAGRYAVQPSEEDGKEWRLVLDLLRSDRNTDTPLNGVVIAIPVDEVLGLSEDQIEEYAQPLRDRIDEITKRLRIQLPIYVTFTKMDKLSGFADFFEALTKEERQQLWGATLPYTENLDRLVRERGAGSLEETEEERKSTSQQQVFEQECKRLTERLYARRIEILSGEQGQEAKERVYLFPRQFEIATNRFSQVIAALFRLNPFQETLVFRGFSFTSATQKGRPLQQMNQLLSQSLADPELSLSLTGQGSEKRPYFLTQFFRRVLFPDYRLARPSTSTLRRRHRIRFATAVGSVAATLLIALGLYVSFHNGQRLLQETNAAVTLASASVEPEADTEEARVAAAVALHDRLNGLEELRQRIEAGEGSLVQRAWGMDPSPALYRAARDAYFPYLRDTLVEPCAAAIEAELERMLQKRQLSFTELHEVYDLFQAALAISNEFARHETAEYREDLQDLLLRSGYWYTALEKHPDPFLEEIAAEQLSYVLTLAEEIPMSEEPAREAIEAWQNDWRNGWRVRPNRQLLNQTRDRLAASPWVSYTYNQVLTATDVTIPGRAPRVDQQALLPEGGEELLRYEDSFPAMYTQEYFTGYVHGSLERIAGQIAEWNRRLGVPRDREEIVEELLEKYVKEYVLRWERVPGSLRVLPFEDLDDALMRLNRLAGNSREPSPLEYFYRTLYRDRQLRIGGVDQDDENEEAVVYNRPPDSIDEWLPEVLAALRRLTSTLEDFLDDREAGQRFVAPLAEDFEAFHAEIGGMRAEYNETARSVRRFIDDVNEAMRPEIARVFEQILRETRLAVRREVAAEAQTYWEEGTGAIWQQEFVDHYPFDREAAGTVRTSVFFDVLGPEGRLVRDARILRTFEASLDGSPMLELTREFARALDVARTIREALMPEGEARLDVPFSFRLWRTRYLVDFLFEAGTSSYSLLEGTSTTKRMAWRSPPRQGTSETPYRFRLFARCGVDGTIRDWEYGAEASPFGMLRLLDRAHLVEPGESERSLRYTWILENMTLPGVTESPRVVVELTPDTAGNPFDPDFFEPLRLPDSAVATVTE